MKKVLLFLLVSCLSMQAGKINLDRALRLSYNKSQNKSILLDMIYQNVTELYQNTDMVEESVVNAVIDAAISSYYSLYEEDLAYSMQDLKFDGKKEEKKNSNNNNISKPTPKPTPKPALNINDIQIVVLNQKGISCGYHAVYNAKIIQDLGMSQEPINQESIAQQATIYPHLQETREIDGVEMQQWAKSLNIENLYFFYSPKTDVIEPAYETKKSNENAIRFFNSLKNKHCYIAHAIFNTGVHWVLLSLYKQEEKPVKLFYLDSGNGPLEGHTIAELFVEYIYNLI